MVDWDTFIIDLAADFARLEDDASRRIKEHERQLQEDYELLCRRTQEDFDQVVQDMFQIQHQSVNWKKEGF